MMGRSTKEAGYTRLTSAEIFEINGKAFITHNSGEVCEIIGELIALGKESKPPNNKVNILLTGETGTGKGQLAELYHNHSSDAADPFVEINAGELEVHLARNELFGHEKGAYTGAVNGKAGLVELADGGTLFLDEISNMSPEAQSKLLKFLDTGKYRRIGGTETLNVSTRIIAATNEDISSLIKKGGFRKDLYYRLAGEEFSIPPLRERPEDIRLIATYLVEEYNRINNKQIKIDNQAYKELQGYYWDGNVRQLEHIMDRAIRRVARENQDVIGKGRIEDAIYNGRHKDPVLKGPMNYGEIYLPITLTKLVKTCDLEISTLRKKIKNGEGRIPYILVGGAIKRIYVSAGNSGFFFKYPCGKHTDFLNEIRAGGMKLPTDDPDLVYTES